MTPDPDDPPGDPVEGRPSEGGRKLDEDAAWRAIVEHFYDVRPPADPAADPPADPVADPAAGPASDPASGAAADQPDGAAADAAPTPRPGSGPDPLLDRKPHAAPEWAAPPASPPARRSFDPLNTEATWADEGHFVPPEPPPLPPMDPRRRLAWFGLLGAPLLLLLAVVFRWAYPGWLTGALLLAFVGGFGYLVASMPNRPPDDWSGDDGAVV